MYMSNNFVRRLFSIIIGRPYVRRCPTCGIADNFPGVSIKSGTCNYCLKREKMRKTGKPVKDFCYSPPILEKDRLKYKNQMEDYFKKLRSKPGIHGVVSYSGGKDSTYALYLLTKVYGLNVLPVTVDIGCFNPNARKNIKCTLKKLGIKNYVFADQYTEIFKKIHRYFLTSNKSMFVKGNNPLCCLVCHHVLDIIVHKIAQENSCDFIVSGLDRYQTPPQLNFLFSNKPTFYCDLNPKTYLKDLTHYWTKDVFKDLFSKEDIRLLKSMCDSYAKHLKTIYPLWILGTTTKETIQKTTEEKLIKEIYNTNCTFLELANYIYWNKYGCIINEIPDSNRAWEEKDNRKYSFRDFSKKYRPSYLQNDRILETLKWLGLTPDDLK